MMKKIVLILTIISIGIALILYIKSDKNGKKHYDSERLMYTEMLGEITSLPPGETPKILKVTDLSKIKGQDFFNDAKIGDVVMVFTSTQMAYLYRPESKKIVNSIKVNIYDESTIPNPNPTPAPTVIPQTPTPTPLTEK